MEQGLDHNGDGIIDVYDSQALLDTQQSFNSRESLSYIVGNAGDPDDQFLTSSGDSRQYLFHRPTDIRDGAPVVIVCHGYTGSAEGIRDYSGMNALADNLGFAVCYPQGKVDDYSNRYWMVGYPFHTDAGIDPEQDINFLNELAQYLQIKYSLGDAFQTGFSNGGELSYRLARSETVFKALAPVAGVEFTANTRETSEKYPILGIHGTADSVSLYNGAEVDEFWGGYYGVEPTFDWWCNNNMTNGTVTEETLADIITWDGSTVVAYKCKEGNDSKEVWLYKVVGGGHNWPGASGNMDIDASVEAIKFFQKFNTQTPFDMENMSPISQMRKTDVSLKQKRCKAFAECEARLQDALTKLKAR